MKERVKEGLTGIAVLTAPATDTFTEIWLDTVAMNATQLTFGCLNNEERGKQLVRRTIEENNRANLRTHWSPR